MLVGGDGVDTTDYSDRTDGGDRHARRRRRGRDNNDGAKDVDPGTLGDQSEGDTVDTENVLSGDGDDTLTGDSQANRFESATASTP